MVYWRQISNGWNHNHDDALPSNNSRISVMYWIFLCQENKYRYPLLDDNYHWSYLPMRVCENNYYILYITYGESTINLARTNRIGQYKRMLRDDLWHCLRKYKLFVKCSLLDSQMQVHWSRCLKTASWQLKEHVGTLKQCHNSGRP
jgi:hypothetical protein